MQQVIGAQYYIYNKVGENGAHSDFHRERRLIAVPSLLEGAVAPPHRFYRVPLLKVSRLGKRTLEHSSSWQN